MAHADIRLVTLPQLTAGQDWRLSLAHDRDEHMIVWTTRGQGRALLGGQRRGVGTHNALIVPAGHLFALDAGRQTVGQAILFAQGSTLPFPKTPAQLRIRDSHPMTEFTTLLEAATREQQLARPLMHQAMQAHGALICVWLHRQLSLEEHIPPRMNAAARLSDAFAQRIAAHFKEPFTMADHAQALDVTPTHLTRACKAATGKTAAELLTERVLYEARRLLVTTKVPAQDIAKHLGFKSAAYFTRFMMHHTASTPSALRKAAAQSDLVSA